MAEDQPVFDDEWVASARHREPSVAELKRARRAERRAVGRRKRSRLLVRLAVVIALIGVGIYVAKTPRDGPAIGTEFLDPQSAWLVEVSGEGPTPTGGEGARLLPEVTGPELSEALYAFTAKRDDDSPITYDPCRAVDFVVNPVGAPDGYLAMVNEVLTMGTQASGLVLNLVAVTDEPATANRRQYLPDRYGDRWAPVLIAWTDEAVIEDLAGSVAGVGGSAWIEYGDEPEWYVTGILYLDQELGNDPTANRAVMMHELGHVLGLDHVNDELQVMNPEAGAEAFGAGDLAGLARVGSGRCAGEI